MDKKLEDKIREKMQGITERSYSGIKDSAVFINIFSKGAERDPVVLMQLGMAVLMQKPILVFAEPGTEIPPGLQRIADEIVFRDTKDVGAMAETVKNFMDRNRPFSD